MKTQHTPGPWHVTPSGGIAGDGEAVVLNWESDVAECSGAKAINNGFGRAEANARLIAAAPDLLEACQTALDGLAGMTTTQFSQGKDAPIREDLAEAIRKATNE